MNMSIGFLLDDVARLFRRSFDTRARDHGTTALQSRLLFHLERQGGIRQSELADLIEVEPITLSRMIDRLVDGGLVERRSDPVDRRLRPLFLTGQGQSVLCDIRGLAFDTTEEAMEGLSTSERSVLAALVEKVRANLSRRDNGSGTGA